MVQYINVNIISRILLTFFTIWGLLIIISECLAKKGCNYANKNIIFPVAMLIWCFISFIGNWKNNGLYNIFSLYYYGLCILVLYINGSFLEQDRKELICIAKLYTWLSLIISSICIYMFLWQKSISFPGRNGYEMRMGVWENRLFGVFSSPNVGGTFFLLESSSVYI